MPNGPFLYRFAFDARLDDHAGLAEAARQAPVLPVMVLDRAMLARVSGCEVRARFFCGAVAALDRALRARGSRLIVRRGPAGRTLANLARAVGARGVCWSTGFDAASVRGDAALQSELEERGMRALAVVDAPVVNPEETLREGSGYRAFAPYEVAWRARADAVVPIATEPIFASSELHSEPLPSASEFGAAGDEDRAAGSESAHALLERFVGGDIAAYSAAALVPADERTSHLSVHLAHGTIAARTVHAAVARRLADPLLLAEERNALLHFRRALARRDFFLQLAWFHPSTATTPLQEKMRDFPWRRQHPDLDAWCTGTTGYPLVDAGIRQLRATGWMHPHARAVAASFLCFDLGVDWRVGRAAWARWAADDDPALATGNWQWIAGVGADMAQYPRIYNPLRQQRRYDPQGHYVTRWIPELADVPLGRPDDRRTERQLALEIFGPRTYARPVLDHERVARAFLERYRRFVAEAG